MISTGPVGSLRYRALFGAKRRRWITAELYRAACLRFELIGRRVVCVLAPVRKKRRMMCCVERGESVILIVLQWSVATTQENKEGSGFGVDGYRIGGFTHT